MPDFKQVHGYELTTGWKAVHIISLFGKKMKCWEKYPTHSNEIEEGSFSAWPEDQIMCNFEKKRKKIS